MKREVGRYVVLESGVYRFDYLQTTTGVKAKCFLSIRPLLVVKRRAKSQVPFHERQVRPFSVAKYSPLRRP